MPTRDDVKNTDRAEFSILKFLVWKILVFYYTFSTSKHIQHSHKIQGIKITKGYVLEIFYLDWLRLKVFKRITLKLFPGKFEASDEKIALKFC